MASILDKVSTDFAKLSRRAAHVAGMKELRAAYAELRKVAIKRLQRGESEIRRIGAPWSKADFPTTRSISTPEQLAREYVNVSRFLSSKVSTEKGRQAIREKRRESLQRAGYEIPPGMDDKFQDFMELWRRKYEEETPEGKKMIVDSDVAAEFFDEQVEAGKFSEKSNKSSMSRAFNAYLRAQGITPVQSRGRRRR